MTTEPRASLVEVEQVDREAAADLVERYYPFEKGMARLARSMRGGHCDTATFTQAFARHRLEALRTQGNGERWQSMDSAPMDGTPLLLFARCITATLPIVLVGWYSVDRWIECSFTQPIGVVPLAWRSMIPRPEHW